MGQWIEQRIFHIKTHKKSYPLYCITAVFVVSSLLALGLWLRLYELKSYTNYFEGVTQFTIFIFSYILANLLFLMLLTSLMSTTTNRKQVNASEQHMNTYLMTLDQSLEELHSTYAVYIQAVSVVKKQLDQNMMPNIDKIQFDDNLVITYNEHLFKIKNPILKGLLINKLHEMQIQNLEMNFYISESIDFAPEISTSLIQNTGILLDNAMEAAVVSDEQWLDVSFYTIDSIQYLCIVNSFKGELNMSQISNAGYSTKGKNRGYGLAIAKENCNLSDGNIRLETTIDGSRFIQTMAWNYK